MSEDIDLEEQIAHAKWHLNDALSRGAWQEVREWTAELRRLREQRI